MGIGIFEAGAFGAAAAVVMKSLEFAIVIARQKLNRTGNPKSAETLILDELKVLNGLMVKAIASLEKGSEIMDDTRERVKANQDAIDKMHRDVLLLRGGG